MKSTLKNTLKSLPGVDEAVGLFRYAQYRHALGRAIAADSPASNLPPPHLRYRVHRSFDADAYLATGRAIAASITQALSGAGLDMPGSAILDLGSGPGRVAWWVKSACPSVRLTCADIDAEAIHWANAHMPDVASFVATPPMPPMPPMPFASESFDAIYCISLFTHLDESMQDAWLQEIARMLKPGGLLLATTHGELATSSCTASELAQLQTDGFVFRTASPRRIKLDGLPAFYQTSFHSRRYVQEHWSKVLDVVSHVPGGIQQHQDLIVLRRRTGGLTDTPRNREGFADAEALFPRDDA